MFQQETIKNYQNFIAKDLKGPFVGMKIKQKVIIKIRQTNLNTVSNQIFLESIDHLLQFIETKILLLKDLKLKGITYQNKLLISITSSSLEKTFIINQLILIKKPWKKVKNFAKGQGEDCTTGYLLGYDYIENNYRLTAVDLSKRKELDADPRSIQQIDFVEQTKKTR